MADADELYYFVDMYAQMIRFIGQLRLKHVFIVIRQ